MARFASVGYHAGVILGEIGSVSTLLRGVTAWTWCSALALFLAGLLTFVYPPVGADVRYTRLVWGQPRRALLPWLALLWLVLVSVLRSRVAR